MARNVDWAKTRDESLKKKRAEAKEAEVSSCTFRPKLTNQSSSPRDSIKYPSTNTRFTYYRQLQWLDHVEEKNALREELMYGSKREKRSDFRQDGGTVTFR